MVGEECLRSKQQASSASACGGPPGPPRTRRRLPTNSPLLPPAGLSNLLTACTGFGASGSYIFSQTLFSMRMGVGSALMGGIIVAAELLVFMAPLNAMAFLPSFYFGGLTIWIGLDILKVCLLKGAARWLLLQRGSCAHKREQCCLTLTPSPSVSQPLLPPRRTGCSSPASASRPSSTASSSPPLPSSWPSAWRAASPRASSSPRSTLPMRELAAALGGRLRALAGGNSVQGGPAHTRF